MSDGKQQPFENKGNPVSDAEISRRINHPGGKWHPEYDQTVKTAPPENVGGD